MTESLGGAVGGACIPVSPPVPLITPFGRRPTSMPVHRVLPSERFSDTLETQRGITMGGVIALGEANALKVLRAEEGRDKELIGWIFSGALAMRSGRKLPQLSLLPQRRCKLIS